MKNGVQVNEVTMSQLVKQVNIGYAQENYGIGAQIIVPYHDPWDNNNYNLPFNFGTFTVYGEGKLGLQAHRTIPAVSVPYVLKPSNNVFVNWADSYIYKWLNSYGTEHEITDDTYTGKTGFLGCLPEDFSDVMNTTMHGNIDENGDSVTSSSKVFLPGATNMFAGLALITGNYISDIYATAGDGEDLAWEYWQNRMEGNIQSRSGANPNRVSYNIKHTDTTTVNDVICLPNRHILSNMCMGFGSNGQYDGMQNITQYLPACVIG